MKVNRQKSRVHAVIAVTALMILALSGYDHHAIRGGVPASCRIFVARSLAELPSSSYPVSVVAGTSSLGSVMEHWYGGGGFSDWNKKVEVCLIGIHRENMHKSDILSVPPFRVFADTDLQVDAHKLVDGGYYVWEVSSGQLLGKGILDVGNSSNAWYTYDRLRTILRVIEQSGT